MRNDLEKRLSSINIENNVFLVFIILILMGYYANDLETKYFVNNDICAKEKYYYIMIIIFLIVVIISSYYFIDSYNEVFYSQSKYNNLQLIATTLALISSLIYLVIAISDKNIEAEISL